MREAGAPGFSREDYAVALKDLIERGWVTENQGAYAVTGRGDALRLEAEDATNRYFYAAWDWLTEAEVAELRALLARFCAALKLP